MKISTIHLKNYRGYKSSTFKFKSSFTAITGEHGKAALLDALTVSLSAYLLGSGIKSGGSKIEQSDAPKTHNLPKKQVRVEVNGEFRGNPISWSRCLGDRGASARSITTEGAQDRTSVRNGEDVALPILLYCSAWRRWILQQDIQSDSPQSRLDAYHSCLDLYADQRSYQRWFKRLSYGELQKGRLSPALQAVRNAVISCTPEAKKFYFDITLDQIVLELTYGKVLFDDLNNGCRHRSLIRHVGMVADIAHRMARLNPQFGADAATKTAGVVLIADLHTSQRDYVSTLKRAFPQVQFVVTTYSPTILGSLKPEEAIALDTYRR